jgi:pimeloyl-ACP methyl ester carboxylesterase
MKRVGHGIEMARRGRYRRSVATVVAIGAIGIGLAGCSSGRAASSTGGPVAPIAWKPCAGGLQCADVTVPVDYAHPGGATLAIAVAELPAANPAQSAGTILFNPGGPAESGIQELKLAAVLFPPQLHQHFTIVSFDPRGTGSSGRLDCGTSAASVTSARLLGGTTLPVAAVYDAMVQRCASRFPSLYRQIDTLDTARDLDRIRQALGMPTINYLGVSYGTLLGDAYAQLFPRQVRTMVLDGGVDPTRTLTQEVSDQAAAAQKAFQIEMSSCARTPTCPLGPAPLATYNAVAAQLSVHPASAGAVGGPPVTDGDLASALLLHLTVPGLFSLSSFATAALSARRGNGAALRSMALNLWTDIDGSSLVDPYWALTCNDNPQRVSAQVAAGMARTLEASGPGTGAFAVAYDMAGCSSWPAARHPVVARPARGAPPIVVIGGTGDPNTPYVWSQGLARSLGSAVGVLVTRVGVGHSAFLNGAADTCLIGVEIAYLADRTVPKPGTVCTDPAH